MASFPVPPFHALRASPRREALILGLSSFAQTLVVALVCWTKRSAPLRRRRRRKTTRTSNWSAVLITSRFSSSLSFANCSRNCFSSDCRTSSMKEYDFLKRSWFNLPVNDSKRGSRLFFCVGMILRNRPTGLFADISSGLGVEKKNSQASSWD